MEFIKVDGGGRIFQNKQKNMNKSTYLLFLFIVLLFKCTGEISSLWIIKWKLSATNVRYENLDYKIDVVLDARSSSSYSKIDSSGNLYEQISIYDYNFVQIEEIKPSFKFMLLADTVKYIDTFFTWEEMGFVKGESVKEISF